jgi:dynein heavy chain
LDIIQKSLNSYLESKRAKFARFYFLSNNELLEILSQAKEPLAVQPYLNKVFENVNEVEFDTEGKKTILAMLSAERERVAFDRVIDPKGKNVEDWMNEVEEQMKTSMRTVLLNSVTDYPTRPRQDWILLHPGQCVLNGSQIHWTS